MSKRSGRLEESDLHPLIVIAVFIVVFLAIHPFQDGNGRLSRILTTLLLLRIGYEYVPYSSLQSVIEQSKDSYYLSLRQTQGTLTRQTPDWQPWLNFFLRAMQQQKARLEKKLEHERLILGALPELSVQILELCRERGRVTVAEAAQVTGANRNTIKDHIKALTRIGHLQQHGAGRGHWYALGGRGSSPISRPRCSRSVSQRPVAGWGIRHSRTREVRFGRRPYRPSTRSFRLPTCPNARPRGP